MSTSRDDIRRELEQCEQAGAHGDAAAARRAAELYELTGDSETAGTWWHTAAALGDPDAVDYVQGILSVPRVDRIPCPSCGAEPGCLSITETLVARPLGSWSLAGAQLKTSARSQPVLTCSACPLRVTGTFDGSHVVFPSPAASTSVQ